MFPFGRVMHARLYANLLLLLLVLVLVLALSVLVLACMYLALGWGWCGSMGAGGGVRVAWRTYCVRTSPMQCAASAMFAWHTHLWPIIAPD